MHQAGLSRRVFWRLSLGLPTALAALPVRASEDLWQRALQAGEEAFQNGDYSRAAEQFEAAWEQAQGFAAADPRRAETLLRLARAYRAQGDLAKPEALFGEAIPAARGAYGPETPEFARYLNEAGRYFHTRRKYDRAEEYYKKAFAIRVRALGKEHPEVAESINNLAILYENKSLYNKAEVYYQHALAIREKILGPDHPETIATTEHLARLLHKLHRVTEAAPLRERAAAARSRWVEQAGKGVALAAPGEIYSPGDPVQPPRLSQQTDPEYTEEARIARHEGTVVLQADISAQGEAGNFRLVRSLGLGLDEKAVEAVKAWRFEPARRGKERVPFRAVLEIHFRVL